MDTQSYRELKVLEELSVNSSVTQRHLAMQLKAALGLTNLMMRRLIKKGYVKVVNIQNNRLNYLLTPQGVSEKTRLTYEYLEYSLHLYRTVRLVLREALAPVARSGGKRIVLFGAGEIAEIAYLTLKELQLQLVGVVDDRLQGQQFLGLPVLSFKAAASVAYDCGVVASVHSELADFRRQLEDSGVAMHKIIIMEQRGPNIRAVHEQWHA